ncbi:MAG: endonuclease/exonuclease/phosphatase family protein, partial [Spirochaetes bacterium]|nr:endonuclease/exonuclease/phosphatase family protein [Spirochaetota bacterium]MBU0954473.1 endonuclease/exonuclease/phosphatase family protein [Spirochaetota bacterium]
ASFNAENFFMLLDRDYRRDEYDALSEADYLAMNTSIFNPNKERSKLQAIADTILAGNFDVIGLCEVGGMETLQNFNRLYLDNAYNCFLHQENSRRGIFVGALIRRGRFRDIKARNVRGNFSRNLLRLDLSDGWSSLKIFVVHLKSQYGQDKGIEQRIKEVNELCSLLPRDRCVVMGDFNGLAIPGQHQFEFEPFLELPFRDVLEAMDVPPNERFTHYYFSDQPHFNQLDYIFISNDLPVTDGRVIMDLVPLNFEQRRRMPSDHLFIEASIKLI